MRVEVEEGVRVAGGGGRGEATSDTEDGSEAAVAVTVADATPREGAAPELVLARSMNLSSGVGSESLSLEVPRNAAARARACGVTALRLPFHQPGRGTRAEEMVAVSWEHDPDPAAAVAVPSRSAVASPSAIAPSASTARRAASAA